MVSFKTCMARSTTSSVYFDIAFAILSANIDEELDVRIDDIDITTATLPKKPSWWFYNFRMYSQLFLLVFNVAKFIYSAIQNDTNNALLSALRSICVLGILIRHYYICNYKFMDLVLGKLTRHLLPLQIAFMASYNIVGAISGGIDPFFASDSTTVIIFFLVAMSYRALSFATASLYSKAMTTTVADGTVVVPQIPSFFFFYFYGTVFNFSLAGADMNSKFFTDRLLCGVYNFLSFASVARSLFNRKKKREQVFVEHLSRSMSQASLNELVNGDGDDDSDGKFDDPMTNERGDRDRETINSVNDTTLYDHQVNVLELFKQFTENKIFVLITPVACSFMVIISFELAMSMYIYQRDGVPANWCEPFSFTFFDQGFQIVLDYFL